ncbi:hypothetical protein FY534_13645 (plasmid) [Alicyclobacillus sp. TC]|nr:hypothetical protein FY534_13645 [Alicyclobacillus sp. TC]
MWFQADDETLLTHILRHYLDGTLSDIFTAHRGQLEDGRSTMKSTNPTYKEHAVKRLVERHVRLTS